MTTYEELKQEHQKRLKEIEAYWDKKTLWVHRKALIIGFLLGILQGLNLPDLIKFIQTTW